MSARHSIMTAGLFPAILVTTLVFAPSANGQSAIIIDHTCTDLSLVPAYWIDQAKLLTFHYAHTSHGSQVVTGVSVLEGLDSFYSIAIRTSGTEGLPPVENPPALRMYDGNPPETYITPDGYWESSSGIDRTRAVASTGSYDFSMWSWCGQASSYSEAQIANYLSVMAQFEDEYPDMRFILMTGHTDGSGVGGTLNQRNNQIRAYALANNMVLFDFADIESYDPDGNGYLALGCNDNGDYSGGNWPQQWCAAHPGHPLCTSCSCAHSQPTICNLKGRAFWWMMARLAGWPGPVAPDLDGDRDVDNDDFDLFEACASGSGVSHSGSTTCEQADFDGDSDVDQSDFGIFQRCMSGENVQADPLCDG
ncbi:MAG: hypothetical protein GX616_27425 [Planctomycetes bacterium]|nr:hypothetical protein [Planctomycetota bacterium]